MRRADAAGRRLGRRARKSASAETPRRLAQQPAGAESLAEKRLWSVEDPFLYDLKLVLLRGGQTVDQVDSYFGLREVTIRRRRDPHQRQAASSSGLVLDQGFYPDGIWTAPSDDALRERHRALAGRGLQRRAAAPEGFRAAVPLLGRQAGLPGLGRVSQLGL